MTLIQILKQPDSVRKYAALVDLYNNAEELAMDEARYESRTHDAEDINKYLMDEEEILMELAPYEIGELLDLYRKIENWNPSDAENMYKYAAIQQVTLDHIKLSIEEKLESLYGYTEFIDQSVNPSRREMELSEHYKTVLSNTEFDPIEKAELVTIVTNIHKKQYLDKDHVSGNIFHMAAQAFKTTFFSKSTTPPSSSASASASASKTVTTNPTPDDANNSSSVHKSGGSKF